MSSCIPEIIPTDWGCYEGCWLPNAYSLPWVGGEPAYKLFVALQALPGESLWQKERVPRGYEWDTKDACHRGPEKEQETKISLRQSSFSCHPLHNLVTDTQFASENRQEVTSGSKLGWWRPVLALLDVGARTYFEVKCKHVSQTCRCGIFLLPLFNSVTSGELATVSSLASCGFKGEHQERAFYSPIQQLPLPVPARDTASPAPSGFPAL